MHTRCLSAGSRPGRGRPRVRGLQFCCQPLPGTYSRLPEWDLQPETPRMRTAASASAKKSFDMALD